MDLDNFNKDLASKIKDHKVDLDKDQLWSGIQKKRNKGRWRLLLPLLLFLAASSWFMLKQISDPKTDNQIAEEKSAEIIKDVKNVEESSDAITSGVLQPTKAQEEKTFTPPTASKEKKIKESKDKVLVSRNSENNRTLNTSLSTTFDTTPSKFILNRNQSINAPIVQAVLGEDLNKPQSITPKEISNTTLKNSKPTSLVPSSAKKELQDLDKIEGITLNVFDYKRNTPQPNFYEQIQTIKVNAKRNPIALSLYSSYGNVSRELDYFGEDKELLSYLEQRTINETVLEELAAGVGLHYHFNRSWYLQTGLEFSQITEKFLHTDSYQNAVSTTGTIMQIIGPDPEMVQNLEGTLNGVQTVRDNYTYYNTYRFLDIPLVLGYSKSYRKMTMGLEMGTLVNLKLNYDGNLYNQELEVTDGNAMFKSRIGMRYLLAAKIGYKLNNNFSLFGRPSFVFKSQAINSDVNPLTQNYKSARIQLGLEYKF